MPKRSPKIEKVNAKKIAFLSDTHFRTPNGSDVPKGLLKALSGVDLIVHLGHVSVPAALDKLETVAPVIAVQTPLDDRIFGDALSAEQKSGRTAGSQRVIEAGGLLIGLVHNLAAGTPKVAVLDMERLRFPTKPLRTVLSSRFGRSVDIVAFANTHADIVAYRDGVLFINPGSPNLPGGPRKGRPGTIAVLDVARGTAHVEIVELPRR